MKGKPEAPRGKGFFSSLFLFYILLIYRMFHFEAIQNVECPAYRKFAFYFPFYSSCSECVCVCGTCFFWMLFSEKRDGDNINYVSQALN